MVDVIGDPDGPDHTTCVQGADRALSKKGSKKKDQNRESAIYRLPDLDREGMQLYAGKSIGANTPWAWFRLDVLMMRPGVIHVNAYKVVRVADGNEAAQLEKSFERGLFTLAQCHLNAELCARISQGT